MTDWLIAEGFPLNPWLEIRNSHLVPEAQTRKSPWRSQKPHISSFLHQDYSVFNWIQTLVISSTINSWFRILIRVRAFHLWQFTKVWGIMVPWKIGNNQNWTLANNGTTTTTITTPKLFCSFDSINLNDVSDQLSSHSIEYDTQTSQHK